MGKHGKTLGNKWETWENTLEKKTYEKTWGKWENMGKIILSINHGLSRFIFVYHRFPYEHFVGNGRIR